MAATLLGVLALVVGVVVLYRIEETNRRIASLDSTMALHVQAAESALAACQGLSEGKVLREAARRWEAPSEQPRIALLAKHHNPEDMRPLPARWLLALAEEVEGQ